MMQRNGGRGLSFDQVDILEEARSLRITRPLAIIKYYENSAKVLRNHGKLVESTNIFIFIIVVCVSLNPHFFHPLHNNLQIR